ncbi:hypothetical protein IAT38_006831 [Cryptococcus sp. DSM 104549]
MSYNQSNPYHAQAAGAAYPNYAHPGQYDYYAGGARPVVAPRAPANYGAPSSRPIAGTGYNYANVNPVRGAPVARPVPVPYRSASAVPQAPAARPVPTGPAAAPVQAQEPKRATFNIGATGAARGEYGGPTKVLFSNMPKDIAAEDLRDLLISDPLRLSALTTSVTNLFRDNGEPLGVAMVCVKDPEDAERIRRAYNGETIDGQYSLAVHHVLPSSYVLPLSENHQQAAPAPAPAPAAQPMASTSQAYAQPHAAPVPTQTRAQQIQQQQKLTQAQSRTAKGYPNGNAKALPGKPQGAKTTTGLDLLKRLSKPGQEVGKLNSPKAKNISNKPSTAASLLSRMSNPTSAAASHSSAKTKAAKTKANQRLASATAGGASKVGRAKAKANDAMDVDEDLPAQASGASGTGKKSKPVKKTQEDLDEELRLLERARKFGVEA